MVDSPIARFLWVSACIVVVIAGMKAAEPILVPFLLSLFIAVICTPPFTWLQNKRVPMPVALLVIMSIVVCSTIGVGLVVSATVSEFSADLPKYQERLTLLSHGLFGRLADFGLPLDYSIMKESFNPSVAFSVVGNTLASFGNLMSNAFLILLTVTFILVEESVFAAKFKQGYISQKSLKAINNFTDGVHQYMAIKTLISLLTGLFIVCWLWFLGVDYFVLWGLLAFLLNFIPTLGSILAAIPAVLLALVQLGVGEALLTGAGFLFVNIFMGNIVEPRAMGRGLNLSALVVFLSLVFWGWVLGPVGMLLSIPLTMTVKIALENFDDTRWLATILGGPPEKVEE